MTPITALRPLLLAGLFAALASPAVATASPRDSDGDGMPNAFEKRHHLKVKVKDGAKDAEHDGLSNLSEYRAHTNPRKRDSDRDGTSDAKEDADDDGVTNGVEQKLRTHLDDSDSDDDGKEDGDETAGTVVSFAGNVLTLRALDGATIVGTVAATTEIKCGDDDANGDDHEDDDRKDDDHEDQPKPTATPTSEPVPAAVAPSSREDREDDNEDREDDDEDREDDDEDREDDDEDRARSEATAQLASEASCGVSAIVAGAGVHEAEIEDGVFKKVELA